MQAKTIVFLGAGRVATQLGEEMKALQLPVSCVWSRTTVSARKLGLTLDCVWTNNLADIPPADLYIILVKDDAIESVARQLSAYLKPDSLLLHTSGAVPSTVLKPFAEYYGVFYPLQTFSKGIRLDFSTIPLCIYVNHQPSLNDLRQLADKISRNVYLLDDEQRAYLHLSAIFVNNFTNYLQHISTTILNEQKLPLTLLKPLLDETVKKLELMSPEEAQTGPAIRGDEQTINRHLALLANKRDWQEIYRNLSDGIQKLR